MKQLAVLKTNWFPILAWTVGLIFAATNIWTSMQVSNSELVNRVKALELEQQSDDAAGATLLPRFFVLEQKVDSILQTIKDNKDDRQEDTKEIKAAQLRLEQKVDTLLLQR